MLPAAGVAVCAVRPNVSREPAATIQYAEPGTYVVTTPARPELAAMIVIAADQLLIAERR